MRTARAFDVELLMPKEVLRGGTHSMVGFLTNALLRRVPKKNLRIFSGSAPHNLRIDL